MLKLARKTMYDGIRRGFKANLGTADRAIRILVAIGLAAWTILGGMQGWIIAIPLAVAVYLLVTGDLSYSPLYRLFGWSTVKKEGVD